MKVTCQGLDESSRLQVCIFFSQPKSQVGYQKAKRVELGMTGSACQTCGQAGRYWYKDEGCRPQNSKGRYQIEKVKAAGMRMTESSGYQGM